MMPMPMSMPDPDSNPDSDPDDGYTPPFKGFDKGPQEEPEGVGCGVYAKFEVPDDFILTESEKRILLISLRTYTLPSQRGERLPLDNYVIEARTGSLEVWAGASVAAMFSLFIAYGAIRQSWDYLVKDTSYLRRKTEELLSNRVAGRRGVRAIEYRPIFSIPEEIHKTLRCFSTGQISRASALGALEIQIEKCLQTREGQEFLGLIQSEKVTPENWDLISEAINRVRDRGIR